MRDGINRRQSYKEKKTNKNNRENDSKKKELCELLKTKTTRKRQ